MSRRSTFTAISRRRRRIRGRSCTYVSAPRAQQRVRLTPSPRSVHVQHVGPSDNHRRVLRAGDAGRRRRAVQRTQHLPTTRTGDADAAHAAGAERLLPQVPGLRARPSFWDWCARKCSISLCVFFRSLNTASSQWFKWYDEPSNGRPKYGSCGENSNCECALGCV